MVDRYRAISPVANLYDEQGGKLDRQLLFGEGFEGIKKGDWIQGCRMNNQYAGWVRSSDFGKWSDPTNRVKDLGAHVYPSANIKTEPLMHLPYQADLTVVDESGDFVELTGGGYVHQRQIEAASVTETDYVRTAERYLGVPYLWGGNSQYGIDCSGLVTAALQSVGYVVGASNSGEQSRTLGMELGDNVELRRGDFIFWKGHVGIMFSKTHLLHANGYHMKVAFEPLADAITRIAAAGDGSITTKRRFG